MYEVHCLKEGANQGVFFFFFFFFHICDVAELVIIHYTTWPNLAINRI